MLVPRIKENAKKGAEKHKTVVEKKDR